MNLFARVKLGTATKFCATDQQCPCKRNLAQYCCLGKSLALTVLLQPLHIRHVVKPWASAHTYIDMHFNTDLEVGEGQTACGCALSHFSLCSPTHFPSDGTHLVLSACFARSGFNFCIISLLPYYSVHYLSLLIFHPSFSLSLVTVCVILTTTPEYLCKQTNRGGEFGLCCCAASKQMPLCV